MTEPLVIWGAGAIGGTVGAYLLRAGEPVLFVDKDRDHVDAVNRDGIHITGPIEDFRVPARATTPDRLEGKYRSVFLCVKAHHTAEACAQIEPHLRDDGAVVSLQNGLNERIIRDRLGEERTIGAFINFGADYQSPGIIHFGGRGAVVIGELDGRTTPRVEAFHRQLLIFDDRAILTDNIWGFLWGKLGYGALLFATALTDASIADVLASARHRKVLIALAREILCLAAAEGVRPEGFDGYDPHAFTGSDRAANASVDELVAFNRRSAKSHSGIWRDLAVRKRKTEVDTQLGPILEIAAKHDMAVPLTTRLIELVRAIEDGKRPLDWANLDDLAAALDPSENMGVS